jgi:hypothetical protein
MSQMKQMLMLLLTLLLTLLLVRLFEMILQRKLAGLRPVLYVSLKSEYLIEGIGLVT